MQGLTSTFLHAKWYYPIADDIGLYRSYYLPFFDIMCPRSSTSFSKKLHKFFWHIIYFLKGVLSTISRNFTREAAFVIRVSVEEDISHGY